MTIFAMLFGEQPRSLQADKVKGYKQRLSEAARVRFPAGPTLDDPLYARITWFHRIREWPDVDNLVKPILGSLQGVVFRNDYRVGSGVLEVSLHSGHFGDVPEIVAMPVKTDFPFRFDLLLDHHLKISKVYKIEVDTSSFDCEPGASQGSLDRRNQ